VHALLAHLELVGFKGAPRVLGFDSEGREVRTFIAGGGPSHTDDELARVAQLIRELHDATEAFEAPPDPQWQFMVGARRCANASGSSTTLRASGAKPDGRVGGTFGTTRTANNGYADCDTSRRSVVSGSGTSPEAKYCVLAWAKCGNVT
jgi:hypothetical protein